MFGGCDVFRVVFGQCGFVVAFLVGRVPRSGFVLSGCGPVVVVGREVGRCIDHEAVRSVGLCKPVGIVFVGGSRPRVVLPRTLRRGLIDNADVTVLIEEVGFCRPDEEAMETLNMNAKYRQNVGCMMFRIAVLRKGKLVGATEVPVTYITITEVPVARCVDYHECVRIGIAAQRSPPPSFRNRMIEAADELPSNAWFLAYAVVLPVRVSPSQPRLVKIRGVAVWRKSLLNMAKNITKLVMTAYTMPRNADSFTTEQESTIAVKLLSETIKKAVREGAKHVHTSHTVEIGDKHVTLLLTVDREGKRDYRVTAIVEHGDSTEHAVLRCYVSKIYELDHGPDLQDIMNHRKRALRGAARHFKLPTGALKALNIIDKVGDGRYQLWFIIMPRSQFENYVNTLRRIVRGGELPDPSVTRLEELLQRAETTLTIVDVWPLGAKAGKIIAVKGSEQVEIAPLAPLLNMEKKTGVPAVPLFTVLKLALTHAEPILHTLPSQDYEITLPAARRLLAELILFVATHADSGKIATALSLREGMVNIYISNRLTDLEQVSEGEKTYIIAAEPENLIINGHTRIRIELTYSNKTLRTTLNIRKNPVQTRLMLPLDLDSFPQCFRKFSAIEAFRHGTLLRGRLYTERDVITVPTVHEVTNVKPGIIFAKYSYAIITRYDAEKLLEAHLT